MLVYELVSEIDVKAPVATVQAILTDFASYPKWTGAARVTEKPDDPTRITYVIRVIFGGSPEKPWAFPGRLTINHLPNVIGWRLGMLGFLIIDMQYAFAWTNGATHVRHVVRFKGLLPALSEKRFRRVFQPVMDRILSDLAVRARQASRQLGTASRGRPRRR